MKHLRIIIFLSLLSHLAHSQINYKDSFNNINNESSLSLFGTGDIYMSQNGLYLYAFSDDLIIKYDIDLNTGRAISVSTFPDKIGDPNSSSMSSRNIAYSENDKYLFIASGPKNMISAFEINQKNGDCIHIETINNDNVPNIDDPTSLSVSKDNKYLYVLADNKDQISIFQINIDGKLNYIGNISDETLVKANRIEVTPDNNFIYATSTYDTKITIFSVNNSDGSLKFHKQIKRDESNDILIDGITDIAFDNNGYVHCISKKDNALVTFKSSNDYGELVQYKTFQNGKNNVVGLERPEAVTVDKNQGNIYVCTSSRNRNITTYYWDKNNELMYSKPYVLNVYDYNISDMKISNNSKFLYGGQYSNSITSFFDLGAFVNLGEDIDACEGNIVRVTPDVEYSTYKWSNGSTEKFVEINQSSTLFLDATDSYGRTGTDTINITFNELPQIYLGEDTTIFYGDSLCISVNTIYKNYLWNNLDSTYQTCITGDLAKNDSTIWVRVANQFGCYSYDSLNISFIYPEVNLGADTTIFVGDSITFNLSDIYDNYLWNNGDTTNNMTFISGSIEKDTIVYIDVTGKDNWHSSDTISISILNTEMSIENNSVSNINIYPNPVLDILSISGKDIKNIISIKLFDSTGKRLFIDNKKKINQIEYNLKDLDDGIYFLQLQSESSSTSYKLMKINK